MDFDDTPEEAAFRAEVKAWLAANAPQRDGQALGELSEFERLARARAWQKKKAAARYAAITWAKEAGGRGGTAIQQVIYNQEEAHYDIPRGYFEIGLGMCVPTLLAYGTPEQIARYAPPALSGDEIWCQLFSEPGAGSDVAGLASSVRRDGDHWILNGQKVWTSGAQYSDYGIVVARHDPALPKHQGLTFFFMAMNVPGVEIRPIKQINGGANFNEVFFTDVRIPDAQRLGAVGDGWKVALTTLMHERLAVGSMMAGPETPDFMALVRELTTTDLHSAVQDGAVRERIADWYVREQGLKYTRFRALTALSKGEIPGPENAIAKVVAAKQMQDLAALAMDLEDMAGIIVDERLAPLKAAFQRAWMWAPGLRIAGGTDEILRNIIAERVLGLPGEIRVDKTVPFNQLPRGTR